MRNSGRRAVERSQFNQVQIKISFLSDEGHLEREMIERFDCPKSSLLSDTNSEVWINKTAP